MKEIQSDWKMGLGRIPSVREMRLLRIAFRSCSLMTIWGDLEIYKVIRLEIHCKHLSSGENNPEPRVSFKCFKGHGNGN